MSDLALPSSDPAGRFTGLSDVYARYRPDYPAACIDFIVSYARLDAGTLVADVGCGTGISSRLFAARGIPVVGIEPNDAMRARAESVPSPNLAYRSGSAEHTNLEDGVASLVLAAQAFHWFDAPAALREFHRILRAGGCAALVWNERDERDPCTAAFGEVIRSAPGAAAVEGPRVRAGPALLESPRFGEGLRTSFFHEQPLDEEGLLGRAFSISYAPREPNEAGRFEAELRKIFARFQQSGQVVLRYETTLYLARRG